MGGAQHAGRLSGWNGAGAFCVVAFCLFSAASAAARSDWVAAVMQRDLPAIVRLLPRQVDVDERTEDGRTALMLAAGEGQPDLVRALLARRAAVNATNQRGGTPLMYAATAGDAASLTLLLSNGAAVNARARNGWTALTLASARGFDRIVTTLLDRGADPNIADIYGWTPLMRAVHADHADAVHALLASTRVDVGATDDTGKTALHHAAAIGSVELVRALLARGASIRERDRDGRTAHDLAIDAKYAEVAKVLWQAQEQQGVQPD